MNLDLAIGRCPLCTKVSDNYQELWAWFESTFIFSFSSCKEKIVFHIVSSPFSFYSQLLEWRRIGDERERKVAARLGVSVISIDVKFKFSWNAISGMDHRQHCSNVSESVYHWWLLTLTCFWLYYPFWERGNVFDGKRKQPHDGYDHPSKTIPKFNIYDVTENVNEGETRKRPSCSIQLVPVIPLGWFIKKTWVPFKWKYLQVNAVDRLLLNSRTWKTNGSWSSLEKFKQDETSFSSSTLEARLFSFSSRLRMKTSVCFLSWSLRRIRTEQPTHLVGWSAVVAQTVAAARSDRIVGLFFLLLLLLFLYFYEP